MATESYTYIFHGMVYPLRTNIHTPLIEWDQVAEEEEGKISIGIGSSQVMVVCEFPSEKEIYSLKNAVLALARNQTDIYAFATGQAVDVHITTGFLPDKRRVVFGNSIPTYQSRVSDDEVDEYIKQVYQLFAVPNGKYLRSALGEFKKAILNPQDTGFHCFRAIESIRHYFRESHNISKNNRDLQWRKLRDELGFERSHIDFIEQYQKGRRHGEVRYIPESERGEIADHTWNILAAFIEHLRKSRR